MICANRIAGRQRLRSILFACSFIFIAFFYLATGLPYFDQTNYHFDEGIVMQGASSILQGALPYRDFWTLYSPGPFFSLAAVFKLFGANLWAAIIFAISVSSITAYLIFRFMRDLFPWPLALPVSLLSLACFKSYMVYNRPSQFALLFCIVSWFYIARFIENRGKRSLIMIGVISGIIGLFRIDFGIYNLISVVTVITLKNIYEHKPAHKVILSLFLPFVIINLSPFVLLIISGDFSLTAKYILSGTWAANRYLPLPALKADTFIFYLPLAAAILSSLLLAGRKNKDKLFWLKLYFTFLVIFLYYYAVLRLDRPHLFPSLITAVVLLALLCGGSLLLGRRIFLLSASIISCFFLFYAATPGIQGFAIKLQKSKSDIPKIEGLYDISPTARSQAEAIKYIQDRTGSGEKIFVANPSHGTAVYNDLMFYFLSGRKPATKYYQFEPGFTNTRIIQRKIISDLKANKNRYIVIWDTMKDIVEPNASAKPGGITDLDDFIRQYYRLERKFSDYSILKIIPAGQESPTISGLLPAGKN